MKSRLIRSSLSAGALITLSTVAQAADVTPSFKAPAAPAVSWTGCYFGANAGGAFGAARYEDIQPNTNTFGLPLGAFDPRAVPAIVDGMTNTLTGAGFTGGGQFGCAYQAWNNFVFGWESDLAYTGLHGSFSESSVTATGAAFSSTQTFGNRALNTNRIRLGFVSGSWMFYITGGFAFADVNLTDQFIFTSHGGLAQGIPLTGVDTAAWAMGWTVGAGAEWMFDRNWSFKVEYLYTDVGTISYIAQSNVTAVSLAFIDVSHRLSENLARVGFNYHFYY
jgi:outer membrane immunogenic protein